MTHTDNLIERATLDDVPQIVALGYNEFEENDIADLGSEIDYDKTLLRITSLVLEHLVIVKRNEENPKIIDGVAAFQVSPPWFSHKPLLISILLYIKPEKRSFKSIKKLMEKVKEYAIMGGIPIVFELFTQKDVVKKRKLFTYLGFEDWGSGLIWKHKEEG